MAYSDWREYQVATAEVFRRLGCNAQVDFKVRGVRASHDIDVYATFVRSGIQCTWVVECKFWTTKVPKEKVLALKAIVDDVGADRGILVSEVGFQPGAQDAARGSNITLITSLKDFEKTALAATTETPLVLCEEQDEPPIYCFPNNSCPQELLTYGSHLITANWADGSISIINPATKSIVRTIELDKYEAVSPRSGEREIRTHPPGDIAIADGRLFVGQVFSDVIVVIDLETHAVVKRIAVPGGGEGKLSVAVDEKTIFFASNKVSSFYIIDTATYELKAVSYPQGGRGCMSLLRHPTKPLLYIGVSRGGKIRGRTYPHANCYVAVYDLSCSEYIAETQLAEIFDDITDDATPACLTYDEAFDRLYVGMFQSQRGICILNPSSGHLKQQIRFTPNPALTSFNWVDPLSQAIGNNYLLSVNRNNCELVILDRDTLELRHKVFLGSYPNGPSDVVLWDEFAIVSYPHRNGLIFVSLDTL